MKSAVKANGLVSKNEFPGALLSQRNDSSFGTKFTVQQALGKWYTLLTQSRVSGNGNTFLFSDMPKEELISCLQADIDLIPSVLMDELIAQSFVYDKEQYVRLVQAQLVNLSDCLYQKGESFLTVCEHIENVIQFLQNFFYQYFDLECRLTEYNLCQFCECAKLKLNYWRIKLNQSVLIDTLEECLNEKRVSLADDMTYRKLQYLKYLLNEIESATTILTEEYVREVLVYNNFNSICFANYEIDLIKQQISKVSSFTEITSLLYREQNRVSHLKIKPGIYFDTNLPSVKKQLVDWITEEIKQVELRNNKATDKDLLIDTESKIQTSLSVAKLAVLIRLLVVDKIIINKSIAPMLRTVTKLFTTIQKDEISFGSLETKYHAPDKATLNSMKDIMQKWIRIIDKL